MSTQVSNRLWRISGNSPAKDAAIGSYGFVTEDMDGQLRDSKKDVGADEYSTSVIVRHPVGVSDVGPDADYNVKSLH